MLCVLTLYVSGGPYSLKSTPNEKMKLFLNNDQIPTMQATLVRPLANKSEQLVFMGYNQ